VAYQDHRSPLPSDQRGLIDLEGNRMARRTDHSRHLRPRGCDCRC